MLADFLNTRRRYVLHGEIIRSEQYRNPLRRTGNGNADKDEQVEEGEEAGRSGRRRRS
jgi:hypothetical protein